MQTNPANLGEPPSRHWVAADLWYDTDTHQLRKGSGVIDVTHS